MAELEADNPTRAIDEPEEEEISHGPINIKQNQEYLEGLEKILDDFKD